MTQRSGIDPPRIFKEVVFVTQIISDQLSTQQKLFVISL